MEQMNELVELFFEENNKYWGESESYKFYATSETINDASDVVLDSQRFIKMNFQLFVKAYLLPEYIGSTVTDKVTTSKKEVARLNLHAGGTAQTVEYDFHGAILAQGLYVEFDTGSGSVTVNYA